MRPPGGEGLMERPKPDCRFRVLLTSAREATRVSESLEKNGCEVDYDVTSSSFLLLDTSKCDTHFSISEATTKNARAE